MYKIEKIAEYTMIAILITIGAGGLIYVSILKDRADNERLATYEVTSEESRN